MTEETIVEHHDDVVEHHPTPEAEAVATEPSVDEKAAAIKEINQAIYLLSTHSAANSPGSIIGDALIQLKAAQVRLSK